MSEFILREIEGVEGFQWGHSAHRLQSSHQASLFGSIIYLMSPKELSKFKWRYWGIVSICFVFLLLLIGNFLGINPIFSLEQRLHRFGPPLSFLPEFVALIALLIAVTSSVWQFRHYREKPKWERWFILSYAFEAAVFIVLLLLAGLAIFTLSR